MIDESFEAKSSEGGCLVQSIVTNCNDPLPDKADLTRQFARHVISIAIELHDLSNNGVRHSVIPDSSCASVRTLSMHGDEYSMAPIPYSEDL